MEEKKKKTTTTAKKNTTPKKETKTTTTVKKAAAPKKEIKTTVNEETPKSETKKDITKEIVEIKPKAKNKTNEVSFKPVTIVIAIILFIAFGMLVGTGLMLMNYNFNFLNIGNKQLVAVDKNLKEFVDVYNELNDEYYVDVDKGKAIESAISGLMSSVGDANTSYLNTEETSNLEEKLRGNYTGIGAEITQMKNGDLVISYIFDDSPAKKVGLKVNDKIKKVEGQDVTGKDVATVASMIKGNEQTTVNVTVERDGTEKAYKLTRGLVNIASVETHVYTKNDKKIGYIGIEVFGDHTPDEFEKALKGFEKDGIKDLIIDVRYNTGGYLDKAGDIISLFLNKKQVMYQLKTKNKIEKVYSTKDSNRKLNVIVLANEYSASASEILAASLKEAYGAKIVGVKTFGKGTVQTTRPLSNGSMIKLTTQEWLTPKGNAVDKKGVEPTVEEKQNEEYYKNPTEENDNQLQKALEEISK